MKNPKRTGAVAIKLRKARMTDIEPIYALITEGSKAGLMLPRSRSDLYEGLRDFVVAEHGGKVVGCGALSIEWDNLAEVKSLVVATPCQHHGIGSRLVRACLAEARRLSISKVFALTMAPKFFERQGFGHVTRESLPHKIWSDCIKCTKFPDCDEFAVAIEMEIPARKKKAAKGKLQVSAKK
jgi:amino-acid N-acetyltransferase